MATTELRNGERAIRAVFTLDSVNLSREEKSVERLTGNRVQTARTARRYGWPAVLWPREARGTRAVRAVDIARSQHEMYRKGRGGDGAKESAGDCRFRH